MPVADSQTDRKKIVLLTPVYNEEENLPLYEREVNDTLFCREDYDFEVLLIDDGSRDRSWQVIQEMSARDSRFRGIRLSRNYGSHTALSAGWPLKRVEALLRAVLRAGAFELDQRKDIPARVVVSEYVDVAHAFVDRDETGMVNAVLDTLARQLRTAEFDRASG